jgi:NADH:ubiquinone oxidoreductase subunit F (NADH-binding)/(2Fe-2S) ferredoxin/Pyruvate/2-oxoacid:ferredoxin oxidoreductase delta subunit
MPRIESTAALAELSGQLAAEYQAEITIVMCSGTACQAGRSSPVQAALRAELERTGLSARVAIRATGCHGFCEQGPLVIIEPANILYCHVTPQDVPEIVAETVDGGRIVERLLYIDPVSGQRVTHESEVPFYVAQERVLLGQNRLINPTRIDDYLSLGGYGALAQALGSMTPQEVIDAVRAAGLRGRGGGGFPTAAKWQATRDAQGEPKVVICNADEGDPGAYMNRSLLEGNPHLIIEGMLIGAYAIGASQGYIYVRAEYPLAVEHVRSAIDQARDYGLLGDNILGSGLAFDIQVARGAGAFVAGESTALMAALEGEVSEPRPKDVHTAEKGLNDLPTTLNNVETWADVPLIIAQGSAAFRARGTPRSPGTKIFALTGQVKNTGLVEVPLGTPLREIVYGIGGGVANGRRIKAVQIGGPSGGCVPESLFDTPVDFDSLREAGAMMGSGGMVVMDESSCMVDVARYFLEFLKDESCGKCVPCRLGIARMLEMVTGIAEGRGTLEQLDLLEELGETMTLASLCGLGKTAANPVLSTLRHFRDEYVAHIVEQRCPAGVCRALVTYAIEPGACTGCMVCARSCPQHAISGERRQAHFIDQDLCIACGMCREVCRFDAVSVS